MVVQYHQNKKANQRTLFFSICFYCCIICFIHTDNEREVKYKTILKSLCNKCFLAQGIAFVIGISGPDGIEIDVENMTSAFEKLNFAVFKQTDLTYTDLVSLVSVATALTHPLNYKRIAFYFAGHGGVDDDTGRAYVLPLQIKDEVEKLYIEEDIVSQFWTENTEKLEYHDCLFFFDCCLSSNSTRDSSEMKLKEKEVYS